MEAGLGKGQGCVLRRALKAVGDGMGNVSDNVAGEGVERQEEGGEAGGREGVYSESYTREAQLLAGWNQHTVAREAGSHLSNLFSISDRDYTRHLHSTKQRITPATYAAQRGSKPARHITSCARRKDPANVADMSGAKDHELEGEG